MTSKFLFRADSGLGIGYGHASRVETLARAVIRAGGEARIVSRPLTGARSTAPDLLDPIWLPFNDLIFPDISYSKEDAEISLKLARCCNFDPDVVVVDHYDLGPLWEETVRNQGKFVVAIDDIADQIHHAELVVELLPGKSTPDRLRGLKYLPVDKAFDLQKQELLENKWNILVSFGGWDPTKHSITTCEALLIARQRLPNLISEVNVVTGSATTSSLEIKKYASQYKWINLHTQLPSLAPLMSSSHVVICSAGNVMTESLASGRTTIAIVTAKNQLALAEYFSRLSIATIFMSPKTATAQALTNALLKLHTNYSNPIFKKHSSRIIDTNGADRLIAEIIKRVKGH